jgi:hypothetical protein
MRTKAVTVEEKITGVVLLFVPRGCLAMVLNATNFIHVMYKYMRLINEAPYHKDVDHRSTVFHVEFTPLSFCL